jgi:hypothetical protein
MTEIAAQCQRGLRPASRDFAVLQRCTWGSHDRPAPRDVAHPQQRSRAWLRRCHCGLPMLCAARLSASLSTNGALTILRYRLDCPTMGAPGVRDRLGLGQSPLVDAL